MQDQKYVCNNCGFDTKAAGYCPQCDEGYMVKTCECGSGKYATDCCEPESPEELEMEKKIAGEVEEEAAELTKIEIEEPEEKEENKEDE